MFGNNKQKALARIRAKWGKEKNAYISPHTVRIYFDARPADEASQKIEDRVAQDLDLDRVFETLDRTSSRIGQQYLYDRLRRPCRDREQLKKFAGRVAHYEQAVHEREELQLILSQLNTVTDYYFPELIFGKLPDKPAWLSWVNFGRGIAIGSLVLSPFIPVALLVLCLVLPAHLFLHYRNKNRIGRFSDIFNRFHVFYAAARAVLPFIPEEEREEAREHLRRLKAMLGKIGWLRLDRTQDQEALMPIWFLSEILKHLTLSELITFYRLLDHIEQYRHSIHYAFGLLGQLDAAISVASYRSGLPYFALPEFLPAGKNLQLEATLHPLLTGGAANGLQLDGKSMLLTGSNMSGKTTFIRTIGLNVLLAQTILTPLCKGYRAPFFHLGSSIRIQDDLEADKSYYLEEVTVIGELVRASEGPHPYLFIIDEMFKGTNTLERVSAAKAVLSYLNRGNNLVLISTHDIELTDHLADEYDLFYFQERVEDGRLIFDYRLKKGKLELKNAIKILEIMDYPKEIIDEAERMASGMKA